MAILIARADGVLTAAATWGVCSAVAAGFLDSEANNTVLTTAYVESATFTPGAVTIDGIAVKVASRVGATGTISVRLAQAGATVAGTEVTLNVSDLDSRAGEQGWYLFKFAPVLLIAATLYTVSAKTSNATQVNLYRNATAANWSRLIRTTTTGAPAAGDSMHVLGEWTAAATKTDRTVTMDSTAATDYGDAVVANPPGFTLGKGGTLTWGTTAATAYVLRLSTRLAVYRGGIINMGTTATKCPRDSSQQLEFDPTVTDGDFGMDCYGTHIGQGQSRSAGKDIVRCLLNTDEAAGQTVLGVDTDTGWLSTDDIAIASTSRTASEAETRVLNGNAGAASVTVSVALTNAHSGTSPTQAEVLLLTRNVRIRSVSTTIMAYVYYGPAAVVDLDWVEFRYLGTTATVGKRGIEVDVTSLGSLAMSYCALREFDFHGIYIVNAASDNFAIDNLTGYKVGCQAANQAAIRVSATTGTNWSLTNIDIVSANTSQGAGIFLLAYGGTLTNIRCNSSGGDGLSLSAASGTFESIHKAWSGFELHTNAQAGLLCNNLDFGVLSNVNLWRNNSATVSGGLQIDAAGRLVIQTGNFFGNATPNVLFSAGTGPRGLVLRSVTSNGDSTFATTTGIALGSTSAASVSIELDNCTFSTASGIKVAHTNDVDCASTGNGRYAEFTLRNTKLDAATEFLNSALLRGRSYIKYQRVDQVTNVHKTVYPRLGTVSYETGTFRTAAPSQKLAPSGRGAGEKLESGRKRKRILSGGTVPIGVYVRKDGTYTGNAPRLMQAANPAIGVLVDTVIASLSVAADVWQQLSGTTAVASENGATEFFVDCDGAAGGVFIEEWS